MFTRPLLIAAALVAALAGAATAGVVAKSSATVRTVNAPVREYHITLSVRHVPAGAVNLVVHGLLGRGVAASTRFDPQAKALGEWLRARRVDVPEALL